MKIEDMTADQLENHRLNAADRLHKKNILFVCMANMQRSPTFENWFKKHRSQYNVKSCGTSLSSDVKITIDLLEWADRVYVMDLEQEMYIYRNCPQFLNKVTLVGCSDEYGQNGLDLIRLIEYWVNKVGL